MIDTMLEGTGALDGKGRLELALWRLFQMVGCSQEEILEVHWTFLVHPEDHSLVRAQDESRKGFQSSSYMRRLVHHKNGMPIVVLISWVRQFDDQDMYTSIVGNNTDITKRKQA